MIVKARRIALAFVLVLLVLSFAAELMAQTPHVDVITIKGTINPVLVDYVKRGIEQAEDNGAQALIIQIDTPGGLDGAMRDIIQYIDSAHVPIVVYVSPSGARAASAGLYILQAAHVAVMAPSTATGAATPIAMGEGGEAEISDELKAKMLNDAIAYITGHAETRGRNVEWVERAVREGISANEREALDLNVIDMVAPDLETLVNMLDGREVTLLNNQKVTLHTQGIAISDVPMKAIEKFLYTLADPNIAYILLSVAMLGITAEIFNPGLIFPGIIGGICLLMAFYSLGMLPVNYAGVLFIVLAFGLFIGEVLTTSFGLFTAGGVVSLVIGSLLLFQGAPALFRVSPWLIVIVTVSISGALAFIISRAIKIHRKQAATGSEELSGKTAQVKVALNPSGTVFYKGELWSAVSENGEVGVGKEVIIDRIEGLTLYVKKK